MKSLIMIAFLKIIFLNQFFFSVGHSDTTNIEQAAFEEFISRVDSIAIITYPKRKYFQKDSSKIYFSGETELHSAMPFALNRMYRRTDFIIIDSLKDYAPDKNSWIYPQNGRRKISNKSTFVIIAQRKKDELLDAGNLRLFMTNRYHHNGFYYVKFVITQDIIETAWYYKLDAKGKVVDIIVTAGVY